MLFEFIDGGANSEVTLRHNVEDFALLECASAYSARHATPNSAPSCSGSDCPYLCYSRPLVRGHVCAPWRVEAARAASATAVAMCLSNMSICALEALRAASKSPLWFSST